MAIENWKQLYKRLGIINISQQINIGKKKGVSRYTIINWYNDDYTPVKYLPAIKKYLKYVGFTSELYDNLHKFNTAGYAGKHKKESKQNDK